MPGVPVRANPCGGDGLRVCRGPEDLQGVRQVHRRTHTSALHAQFCTCSTRGGTLGVEEARREIGRGGTGRHGRVILSNKQGRV